MVFSCINELESGQVVMPDPFAFGPSRRFKIALFPILDEDSMLESVIGIEADMKYLQLTDQLNSFFFEILVMSFLACLLIAYIFARGLSSRLRILTNSLKEIEKKNIPEMRDLKIEELDVLYQGLIDLAKEIRRKDLHLQQLFSRKLEELAFTGGAIAHEIRNPLSAIEMHFGLLKKKLHKSKLAQDESLTEITQQLELLRNLINNFLCYSRQVKPKKQLINLHNAVEEISEWRMRVQKNLICHIKIPEDFEIYFDQAMLQQICENLLNNAADAAKEKDVNVEITGEMIDGICRLSFTNDGPAIPEQIFTRLFTPFVSEKAEGNGIGLALVRKLTEAHNGDIYCRNKPAQVSFVLEVPCK